MDDLPFDSHARLLVHAQIVIFKEHLSLFLRHIGSHLGDQVY